MTMKPVRALVSVSDKTGIEAFAEGLAARGVSILSTGGTHKALQSAGVEVGEVSQYTGFPEMMDGRVKTLHPKVHGGILGRRATDAEVMEQHGIERIDIVVVNLYPFAQTIARADCTPELAIENIDIGGPAMLRSAAKNHADVLVVVDPADYDEVLAALAEGGISADMRRRYAVKAFRHTAHYDATIAQYLGEDSAFPNELTLPFTHFMGMRYGENPHQQAAFYREAQPPSGSVAALAQLQGKALSYNNIADADAALECVKVFDEPACVIVKHANPCGVAFAADLSEAYERAFASDTTSAFGGIIAFNRPLNAATMRKVLDTQFAEVIMAPSVSDEAVQAAKAKKNVRVLACGALSPGGRGREFKRVGGGLLLQDADETCFAEEGVKVVTERAPSEQEMQDLLFAWKVAWFVKSNAIVYARNGQTVGVGAGQMSRVISARIAAMKAAEEGLQVPGSVMASDAFFPFRDGIDAAAEAGIVAVIQPGGSMRDDEVIAAANEHGISMVFTGIRHFRH